MSFMQSKRRSGIVRYALNLVVLVTFLFSNFGFGYAMQVKSETSMLRQSAANSRLETTVAAMGVEALQSTYSAGGKNALIALLADRATDGVEDPVEKDLIKQNIAVFVKDGRTYLVSLIGNGWRIDFADTTLKAKPFSSNEELVEFLSGAQLTWLAGEYTPAELIDAQADAKENLQRAGTEDRIFVADNLPTQVARYSATRTSKARQLSPLGEEDQKALVDRLRAAFDFQRQAVDGITQQDLNAMMAIGLAPMFPIAVGAEDFSSEGGPAVGRITLNHLNEIGVRDTVVGHSATRSHVIDYEKMADGSLKWGSRTRASAGDTSEVVAEKLRQALAAGMRVTYCIGEDLFIRQQDKAVSDVIAQLDKELGSLNLTGEQALNFLQAIAYEPLWAIGTGVAATVDDIQEMHAAIRQWLADKYGQDVASRLIIEYGGSVNTANAAEIFALPDVDGALIGGASLKAASLAEIARIADDVGRNLGKFMHVSANWKAEDVAKRDDLRQHLSALQAADLSNTVIRYYLPFTLLSESKRIVDEAIAASVDEVKRDIKGVRQAFVLDEDGNPSFFFKGEVDSSRFTAVTASSGGYRYAGYDYAEAGGTAPRSIYSILSMIESYMAIAASDSEALKAYRLKLLHEYLEVSGKSKFHRIESPAVTALINKYDKEALVDWKAREAEKARVKVLEVENKKTIAEATSANLGKFLKGRVIPQALIDAANAELKKLVESGLLTRYRVVAEDGKLVIFTARQNSKAIEDDDNIPSAVLNVYLAVLNKAKELGLYAGEDIANNSFSQQAAALQITTSLPTLSYIEPEGWAQSVFGNVRTELVEPVGQPKGFFTTDYQGFTLSGLLAAPLEQIPDEVVQAVRNKLSQYIAEGKLLGADVRDGGATDIDILVTHRYGELNAAVQGLILEAVKEGLLKAQQSGLLKSGVNIASMSTSNLGKALRVKYQTHSIVERKSEPVVIAKIIGAGIGAANIKLYHEFFMPGSTPLKKLGFVPEGKAGVRGFRAIVRRVEDVLKGNLNGDVWEFETSSAFEDKSGKKYPSVDQSLELLALASQPNDYVITAIYTVEGSTVPSTEPIISVVYQPVYAEEGNLRTLNPTFICRSQSGADAVGGVASMFYDVNFVPGGPNGERYVVTRPVTLEEARKAPKEGTAHVAIYGWQSKGNGVIPTEAGTVVDHVAINPPALTPERDLADFLARIMTTHQHDQPYLAPFAAQEQVDPLREAQSHLFMRAPKEADLDPVMDEVEAKVASGEFLSVDDDKADMGGIFGHNFTPAYMLAIDMATVIEAIEQGTLTDGNIIGLLEKKRLVGLTPDIGDDSHILMLGDKSRNSAQSHQLSFLAFVRGYLGAVVAGEKPYGLAQDFAGREAKAAMQNPYFYSKFNERFFEILRTVMPADYMSMVDKMEDGWKKWQATGQSETVLTKGFSGNVSNQGIGSARYLVDVASGERVFGILAGDKMGPAALNRPIREAVYAALAAGEFKDGLVFEIWDAKAYDHLGNIPISELPSAFSDVEESINELKDAAEQEIVRAAYPNGQLNANLDANSRTTVASLLKKAGYVPSKRIFLDAQKDKEAIYLYLADSDRFNIKQVWSKREAGWDIENPTAYLLKPVLGSSVTKLGILAGGEYIGKDDPVMVGNLQLMKHVYEFLKTNPLIIQGDMNGSHWLAAIPTAAKYAVANKESHPIMVGLVYTLSEDGTKMASVEDIFGKEEYDSIRNTMFKFDFEFKKAQLGGQFEPYGTNWRTVEASYPLAKLLRALQSATSPFLVKNKPAPERTLRPVGVIGAVKDLFNTVAGSFTMPSAPADWKGETVAQQKLYKSLLALQSSGVSHKLSEAVLGVAKDAANRKVILISASVLRNDPSLILALQSINEQINQSLGIFGNAANVEANAYQFVLVADDAGLRTTKDIDTFFAAIAEATNNGAMINKDMFARIVTQEDMYEGQISNPADLVKQLNRIGIPVESIVSVVGSSLWADRVSSVSGRDVSTIVGEMSLEVKRTVVVVKVDAEENKVAFASNALFGAVETLATADRKLPEPIVEKLDIVLLPTGAMEVKQEEVNRRVSDEITTYRAAVKAI